MVPKGSSGRRKNQDNKLMLFLMSGTGNLIGMPSGSKSEATKRGRKSTTLFSCATRHYLLEQDTLLGFVMPTDGLDGPAHGTIKFILSFLTGKGTHAFAI